MDTNDAYPEHEVGDVIEVESVRLNGGYIRLNYTGSGYGTDTSGTLCKVEPVEGIERVEGLIATDGERVPLEPPARTFDPDKVETLVDLRGNPQPPFMSTDSATRKLMPVATGFLKYFPDAVLLQAWISRVGNEKHNPGQPMHWDKSKSADEPDAEVRHMLDHFRGVAPDPGLEPLAHLGHLASEAWRANANLQRACDEARAAYERGEEWRK